MIIGFDGSRAFSKDRTGTENYSYQLLKNLALIDSKNTYIVYVRPGMRESAQRLKLPSNFSVRVIDYARLWTQAGLATQTFKDKLDVLFVPAHTVPIIKRPGLKTVVTVHDLGSEYLPGMHQLKQRLYLGFMQRKQLKGATKLIAVSEATKSDLIKRIGIDPKKIEVVYEGYDKELFKPVKGDALVNSLKQFNVKPQEYFLFVGTIQPRKNLERLIKAFKNVIASEAWQSSKSGRSLDFARDDVVPKLVIAGGKGWMADEIYALPKKLGISGAWPSGLEDRVKFLGRVPDKDLPALYSGAIALTFPSLFEGFGLPIIEAQACGCPVITSKVSSMPEVAGKGAILVDPESVEEIAEAMDKMLKNRGSTLKREEPQANVKRFSWEKAAKETLAVLEKVV